MLNGTKFRDMIMINALMKWIINLLMICQAISPSLIGPHQLLVGYMYYHSVPGKRPRALKHNITRDLARMGAYPGSKFHMFM